MRLVKNKKMIVGICIVIFSISSCIAYLSPLNNKGSNEMGEYDLSTEEGILAAIEDDDFISKVMNNNQGSSIPRAMASGNLGDVNEDGSIDIVDSLLVAQYYVGLQVQLNTNVADVDGNGIIDIIDALLIAQYYVGIIDQFPGILNETLLTASNDIQDSVYGEDVAISDDGNTIVVGAQGQGPNRKGLAFIYKRNGDQWVETILDPPTLGDSDYFGASLDISGNGELIVISAPGLELNYNIYGTNSLYIYRWDGSSYVYTRIEHPLYGTASHFGSSIAISEDGNTFVVGARDSSVAVVYSWETNEWQFQTIAPSISEPYDNFGRTIDIADDGNMIVVGAPGYNSETLLSGKVFVFKKNADIWEETSILRSSGDGKIDDEFGCAVSISNNGLTIAVGQKYFDITDSNYKIHTNIGKVYIFEDTGSEWGKIEILGNYQDDETSSFGKSLVLSDDGYTLFIGTDYKSNPDGIISSVNVYKRALDSWEFQSKNYPSDLSDIEGFGYSLDISNNFETLVVGAPYGNNDNGAVYIFE